MFCSLLRQQNFVARFCGCTLRRLAALPCPSSHPSPLPLPLFAVGGFTGSVMIPQGDDMVVASALRSASPLAWYPGGASQVIHCDDFRIDYRPDGSVKQFYSDLSGGGEGGDPAWSGGDGEGAEGRGRTWATVTAPACRCLSFLPVFLLTQLVPSPFVRPRSD
jgi:hypothetical protein